jgi:hypothetical protein
LCGGGKHTFNGIQMFLLDISALVYWIGTRMRFIWNCRQNAVDEATDPRIIKIDNQFDAFAIFSPPMVVKFYA